MKEIKSESLSSNFVLQRTTFPQGWPKDTHKIHPVFEVFCSLTTTVSFKFLSEAIIWIFPTCTQLGHKLFHSAFLKLWSCHGATAQLVKLLQGRHAHLLVKDHGDHAPQRARGPACPTTHAGVHV
jgi:hypothetical protein